MKRSILNLKLFFIFGFLFTAHFKVEAQIKVSDLIGVQIQFKQPLSFALGKYAEDAKAQVAKGEVQYIVNYDSVIKAKETATSPFCTFSVAKAIKHKTQDYAQASNEILEQLHQRKADSLDVKEPLSIKEASLSNALIQLKLESKKENRILGECITPGAQETELPELLIANFIETLVNNQAVLTKKGKDFPPRETSAKKGHKK